MESDQRDPTRPQARPRMRASAGVARGSAAGESDSTFLPHDQRSASVPGTGGARPPTDVRVCFIDDHRAECGIEPICEVLPIAPSTYYRHMVLEADPSLRSARAQRDEVLKVGIRRVWDADLAVYGAEKVYKQLNREGIRLARCPVERLMGELGLEGAVRGRAYKVTTQPDEGAKRPVDLVERNFEAERPNQLWVSDLTYVGREGTASSTSPS